MFRLIKQLFTRLLSLTGSLPTKYKALNNEPCMSRPTLIDFNLGKFNYYLFMISPDKCSEKRNNALDDLFAKVCAPSKAKD